VEERLEEFTGGQGFLRGVSDWLRAGARGFSGLGALCDVATKAPSHQGHQGTGLMGDHRRTPGSGGRGAGGMRDNGKGGRIVP
jgi:hypothetical protein